ncbi:hypothetical protein [Microbacterium sp. T2.11-28]|uniref:hypothetical protein n=1 Tax=Microbacterium sp. T2.11-28 TaxID=3041169 RepID=UPI002477469F|nr:hypothetical protein [Microbacterium sp. T2.11-28]CAI9385817.1 hypothetical protein MICABA_00019 [Microbacterium sp. T2.11-28]
MQLEEEQRQLTAQYKRDVRVVDAASAEQRACDAQPAAVRVADDQARAQHARGTVGISPALRSTLDR